MTEKSDKQLDDEEFQPRGEGVHVPDERYGSTSQTDDHLPSGDYPERPGQPVGTCRACRATIPAHRSKCDSCLRQHVDPLDVDDVDPAREWDFCHLIFAVVEATRVYTAVAKGAAACTLLTERDDDPIESYQLVTEFTDSPSRFLTNRWGDLPPVMRVDSEDGKRILDRIQERKEQARDAEDEAVHDTYLYNEAGDGMQTLDRLDAVQKATTEPIWLVPAIGLRPVSAASTTANRRPQKRFPRYELLGCERCGEQTAHTFDDYDTPPDSECPETPIWECTRCCTPRYGPAPAVVE